MTDASAILDGCEAVDGDGTGDDRDDSNRLVGGKRASASKPIRQRFPVNQGHRQEADSLDFADFMNGT